MLPASYECRALAPAPPALAPPALESRNSGYGFQITADVVNHTNPAVPGPRALGAPNSSFQFSVSWPPTRTSIVGHATLVAPSPHTNVSVFGMPSHGNEAAGRSRPAYDGNTFGPDYVHSSHQILDEQKNKCYPSLLFRRGHGAEFFADEPPPLKYGEETLRLSSRPQ